MTKVNTRKPAKKKAGQPTTARGERRREAILAEAYALFLEKGFAGASLEELVQRVGGSKTSLYAYFGNKEGLFNEVIIARCKSFLATLALPKETGDDIAGALRHFGTRLFDMSTHPERVATLRTLMAESVRMPELAENFYANGPARGLAMLADYLKLQHAAGRIHCPRPDISAVQFAELIKGQSQFRGLMGLTPLPAGLRAGDVIEAAIHTFLNGHSRPRD